MNFLFDECFKADVESRRWYLVGRKGEQYPAARFNGRNVKMHHLIWKLSGRPLPEAPMTIDHINQNPLDNRLENLRIATPSLQSRNASKARKKHNLPRGVNRNGSSKTKPYQAQISIKSRKVTIGSFATPEEASAAYEKKRKELMSLELSLLGDSHQ